MAADHFELVLVGLSNDLIDINFELVHSESRVDTARDDHRQPTLLVLVQMLNTAFDVSILQQFESYSVDLRIS